MERRIEERRYISYYEAKYFMERRIEDSPQINSLQEKSWDYLKTFGDGDSEKASKAIKDLMEMGLKDTTAIMLLNICSDNYSFILSIISSLPEEESTKIDEEKSKKIFEIINNFCANKKS
ncbi:hypothetical protein Calag_1216 [Caldisphaera lagunensis DSM 15908]|uniref:RNA polymerase Rpb4 n=1 Tax=Caldisphaera lagunensis (strain DSM 15908 / JCM 11604 / ANMR 0165 / IC-154) TaxID=1056495 RepID=L0AD05_CALLD|nr:hypothetical protein [Caldisphaera lagunensis]AFZ70935.1 hypothetical protein Calag_1216 [Caldisphaera lagunensis DSM 15908]